MSKKSNEALMIFLDTADVVNSLSDEDAGKVLKGLLNNLSSGVESTDLEGEAKAVYMLLLIAAKRQLDAYRDSNKQRSQTQKRNWANRKGEATTTEEPIIQVSDVGEPEDYIQVPETN